MISFHADSKVWVTEIKAWMYWSGCIGHQYSYPDLFYSLLDPITGRGHRLSLFLPLPVEGGSIH
jgi:hypothetical protein